MIGARFCLRLIFPKGTHQTYVYLFSYQDIGAKQIMIVEK